MSGESITRTEERPRERLDRLGINALSDHELVSLVLGHGTRHASVEALAGRVIAHAAGIHLLPRLTLDEICALPGIGRAQASRLAAAVELGRRTLVRAPIERRQMITPEVAGDFLLPQYGAYPVERFGLILLDTKHRLLRTLIHSIGALDATMADPRDIFRTALGGGAAFVMLFHNHPSGDPEPSSEDVKLTLRLIKAGLLIGIPVVDHLILGDTRYFSFSKAGLIT
jgi:DNA repair protein RadC